MVLKRGVEGSVTRVADAKVAVFSQGVDTSSTETKVRGRWWGGLDGCVGWAGALWDWAELSREVCLLLVEAAAAACRAQLRVFL
jgi:hypothetical protein